MIVRMVLVLNRTAFYSDWRFDNLCDSHCQSQMKRQLMILNSKFISINWRDTTYLDSGYGYCTCCWNVSHCQKQQSYSGLRSPRQWNCTSSRGWCNLTESFLQIIEVMVIFKKGNLSGYLIDTRPKLLEIFRFEDVDDYGYEIWLEGFSRLL